MATRRRSAAWLLALALVAMLLLQGIGRWSDARVGERVARAAAPGDIRMIASTTCVYCAKARAWFTANRVPFRECLIERDADCAAAYRALREPGTPVLLVRGHRVLGFDPQAVAAAFGLPA